MNCESVILLLLIIGGTWRVGRATCVLESDFGFIINCAFKKSSLFRIRNLGGVKAHASLGFSLGDELGFKESISNTEINRRRSAQGSKFIAQSTLAQQANANSVAARSPNKYDAPQNAKSISQSTVPPFKPIPPAPEHPVIIKQNATRFRPSQDVAQPMIMGMALPDFNMMPSKPQHENKTPIMKKSSEKAGNPYISNEITGASLQSILANANISESAIEAMFRQKLSPTTTTARPKKHSNLVNMGKVMNAPREYYPVGYDKNFDDNFASRVELPETSFYCGDQKHFPGLYADEDLGCMVFHVCALTDDGLIMKSFLCPESTLFDQTILKCNWWFYVDCKNSKKIYDSNIPISKSYQLMKALTFFSAYKKDTQRSAKAEKDHQNTEVNLQNTENTVTDAQSTERYQQNTQSTEEAVTQHTGKPGKD